MISALLLRPLLKLACHPTVAVTAASWGITALQANVSALEATRAELEETITQQRALLETLAEAIVARRAELDTINAPDDAEEARPAAGALVAPCHNPTLHGPHRWHVSVLDQAVADVQLADCPGVTNGAAGPQ